MTHSPKHSDEAIPLNSSDTRGSSRLGAARSHSGSVEAPAIALEIENCDACNRAYVLNLLWPVLGHGLLCGGCVERLRDEGLDAA